MKSIDQLLEQLDAEEAEVKKTAIDQMILGVRNTCIVPGDMSDNDIKALFAPFLTDEYLDQFEDENDLYNTQVNMLMGKCEDLQSKLEKKTIEMKNLKLVLQRNKIDYKALLKEKCPLQKKVEKLSKDLKIK